MLTNSFGKIFAENCTNMKKKSIILEAIVLVIYLCYKIYFHIEKNFAIDAHTKIGIGITVIGINY